MLFSCEKGKAEFTLKGTISDNTFNSALTGGIVSLYEVKVGTNGTTHIGDHTIQADGAYSFTFPRNMAESFLVTVRKDNYFAKDYSIPFSEMTIEEDNIRNFSTTAMSWARLHFITSNPYAELSYIKQEGKSDCSECCDKNEQFLYGITDLELFCANDGNTLYSYLYSIEDAGILDVKSAITPAFDTVSIVLNY